MECNYCQGRCIKAGFTTNRVQRYCCIVCCKSQQSIYKYNGSQISIENRIVELNNEGCGIRSIARLLKVSIHKVSKTILLTSLEIRGIRKQVIKGREYELDEMKTYIKSKKKKYWVVYTIDHLTREVIDFTVGKRTKKTLSKIIDTLLLAGAKKIYTDKLKLYTYLIPPEIHVSSQYKINRIERKNLSVRTHLKRLSRKTICFSKSKEMLEACLRVYFFKQSSFSK